MRRLLVTGGAGFIGSNFVRFWTGENPGDRIVILDALTYAGNLASLQPLLDNPGIRFVRGDICDQSLVDQLLRDERIDTVVHFAAESHVDRSIVAPDAFIQTNVIGTHCLLKAARRVWLEEGGVTSHRFHHVSTDEVFGSLGPADPAFMELTQYAPNSPYSASKAAADHIVRAYHHTYGLDVTTSNCSNNYGPYQFPEKLIPLMILNALYGKTLPVYGDGSNVRDWLHVEDHCRGIASVIAHGRSGEMYNIGGLEQRPNLEVVNLVCKMIDEQFANDPALGTRFPDSPAARGGNTSSLIGFVRDRPGHDRRYAIDCSKAMGELGYRPSYAFEEGLERTIRWFLDNESWWRAILTGKYRQWIDEHYGETHTQGRH